MESEDAEGFAFAYSYKKLIPMTGGGGKIKIAKVIVRFYMRFIELI